MEKISKILDQQHPVGKFLPCSSALRHYKHYIFPGLTLLHKKQLGEVTNESAVALYKEPQLYFSLPLPSISTKYFIGPAKNNVDLAANLVRRKLQWKKKKKTLYQVANNLKAEYDMENIEKLISKPNIDNPVMMPYGIARIADHLANDPDENFEGHYNWYYGNTLTKSIIDDHSCLIHAGGDNLDKLYVSLMSNTEDADDILKVGPKACFLLPDPDLIYDVIASSSPGLVCTRQRNNCSIFIFDVNERKKVNLRHSFTVKKKEYPFISMDVKDVEFCTVSMDRRIYFWDSQRPNSCILKAKLPKNDLCDIDNFIRMKYSCDENPYIYAVIDRHKTFLFDKREHHSKPCNIWCPAKQFELCESLSLLVPSVLDNRWFIGSTHSCLLLDTRMGFIQRWTHMLKQPPSVGESFKISRHSNNLKEVLLFGTQSSNELVSIHNSYVDEQVSRLFCPSKVPSRIDILQAAKSVGLLFNPILQKRFECSLIGLTTFKRKKYVEIYTMSSSGDIFYQTVRKTKNNCTSSSLELNEKYVDYLNEWETTFNNDFPFNKFGLMKTRTVDMSDFFNSIDETIQIPNKISNPRHSLGKWKISRKRLHACRDFLAPGLIHDYGIDDIENWASEKDDDYDETVTVSQKVQNWLRGTEDLQDSDLIHVEQNVLSQKDEPAQDNDISELNVTVPPEFDSLNTSQLQKRRKTRRSRIVS